MFFKIDHKCSFCNNQKVARVRRSHWMRLIPGSELFSCSRCRGEFLMVFNVMKIKISKGNSRLINLLNQA